MTLFEEPFYTFRFPDARIIPRFHLDGVEAGRRVSVFRLDPMTGPFPKRGDPASES